MKKEYTITVYTEDRVGILGRLSNIFSRRKINIDYLNTAAAEVPGIHRFTIVVHITEEAVKKVIKQIQKQVDTLGAMYHTSDEVIWQEIGLYKVQADSITEKVRVERLLRQFGARAIVIRKDFIVFEVTGHQEEIERVIKYFEPLGLIEFVRGARVAIIKDSRGLHDKVKELETENSN